MRRLILALLLVPWVASCGQNVFREFADRNSDAAKLFEANKQLNSQNWSSAITTLQSLSAPALASRSVQLTLASAYAGRCGLNFISKVDGLVNNASGNLFSQLLSIYRAASTAQVQDCIQAEAIVLALSSAPSGRSADENLFLSLVGLAKIGAIFGEFADLNEDGAVDGGFNACDPADLPVASLRQVGTGITIALSSLAATNSQLVNSIGTSLTSVCDDLEAFDPALNFCEVTDPAAFTAVQLRAIGGIVRASDYPGLGTCAGNPIVCACP